MDYNKENFSDLRDSDIEKLDNLDKLYSDLVNMKDVDMKETILKEIDTFCEGYGVYHDREVYHKNSYKYYHYLKKGVIEVMREDIRLGMYR